MTQAAQTIIEVSSAFSKWIAAHIVVTGAVITAVLPMLVIMKIVHFTTEELAGMQLGVASIVAAITGQKVTSNVRVGERIDKEVERRTGTGNGTGTFKAPDTGNGG